VQTTPRCDLSSVLTAERPAGPEPEPAPATLAARPTPWWRRFEIWFPLAVFAATRLFTVVVVIICQRAQIALPAPNGIVRIMFPTDAAPGYWVVMGNWDGQWYQQIATTGYPNPLPLDDTGAVDMNAWAFFPLYPLLVGGLMRLTGGDFYVVGGITAMVIGAVAMVLLYRLVDRAVGRWEAVVAVVGVCTFVSAPILQATYTESLALLLVVLSLLLIRARRYWWVAVVLVALALTRNVVVAMVPVLMAHAFVRWRAEREAFSMRDRILLGALAVEAGALTGLWPAVIGLATKNPSGYAQTMEAWKIGTDIKLSTWWNYLGFAYGAIGPFLGIGALLFFAWFMLTKRSWRWGPELWGWTGAYPAYQMLVTNTGPSRLRYAILAFGFTLFIAWFLRLRWWRRYAVWGLVAVALLGLGQQVWYVQNYLIVSHLDGPIYFP
jgi:hypothetical protein